MLSSLFNLFARRRLPADNSAQRTARGERGAGSAEPDTLRFETTSENWSLRRWESAETTRLNSAQWARATDTAINDDLSGRLETLRARCEYEAHNNPLVAGAIHTHQIDVVGRYGPTIQIEIEDAAYPKARAKKWIDAAQRVWRNWFERPDAAGVRSGAQVLHQWVRARYWTQGEYCEQLVSVSQSDDPITLRLLAIAPRRLKTPPTLAGNHRVVLGVERNSYGRPLRYYVEKVNHAGDFTTATGEFETIPADLFIHGFTQIEPDQARGVPGLACALHEIADSRQFDQFVLDASKQAAATGIVLWTQHADAPFVMVNESADMERNTQGTAPPGWQPMQVQPGQPAATYLDYRKERQMAIGRHTSMPLMSIRADASNHNFSSANFDNKGYENANALIHGELTIDLVRLAREVLREATLAARAGDERVDKVLATPPQRIRISFLGWPVRPHADPNKVRKANEVGLATHQITLTDSLASDGKQFDTHLQRLASEFRAMAEIEVTPGLSLLDLHLAALRGPNQTLAETIDEDGDEEASDDGDTATPEAEKPGGAKQRSAPRTPARATA